MKVLLIVAAIGISPAALAQTAPLKVGDVPLVQVKPKAPAGCKFVGTVKGTALWAGDCTATEPGRAVSESTPLPLQAARAIPPGQK
jgi:hypothetical protein